MKEECGWEKWRVWKRDIWVCPFTLLVPLVSVLFRARVFPSSVTSASPQLFLSPLSFFLFLRVSLPLPSPLSSSSSHIRSHTVNAWIGGSPDQSRLSPWSALELSLMDLWAAKSSPALLGKYWRSHHEKVKPCFSGRGFLTACGHLPVVVKTGMLLLYEDRGMMTVKAIWWCVWGM